MQYLLLPLVLMQQFSLVGSSQEELEHMNKRGTKAAAWQWLMKPLWNSYMLLINIKQDIFSLQYYSITNLSFGL